MIFFFGGASLSRVVGCRGAVGDGPGTGRLRGSLSKGREWGPDESDAEASLAVSGAKD